MPLQGKDADANDGKNKNLKTRLVMYFLGLLIMTLGIAVSVKSNLGVSPVSSIPYTITCVWGMEMGLATILFHAFLVLLQILLLRRRFQIKNLLQIAVGVVFGLFTTFCNTLMGFLPTPENILIRLAMILVSVVLIAAGLFLYVPADLVPLAAEGVTLALAETSGKPFPRLKVCFDVTVVVISLVVCLAVLKSPGSVGIGTVAAAMLVGTVLGFLNRRFGRYRDRWLR